MTACRACGQDLPAKGPVLLTPKAVAAIFCVKPKTVTRWADRGYLVAVLTPGGHRRFPADQVRIRQALS